MRGAVRVTLGSLAGGAVGAYLASRMQPLFSPVSGGVGVLTVHSYPKGWDYAVVAVLALGTLTGGLLAGLTLRMRTGEPAAFEETPSRRTLAWCLAALVVLLMWFAHDHPFAHMDPFHEGEHLTPAFLFRSGERPFTDVFVLHGLGTDGGLDALVMGEPPSPLRTRRLQTVLDALTLALLVPIALELTVTAPGLVAAVILSLFGTAAFVVPVFPWFRLAPVLLSTLGLLRYARRGGAGWLSVAFGSATVGVLWSLDTGTYALAGSAASFAALRALKLEQRPLPAKRVAVVAAAALALPLLLLFALGSDPRVFFRDSFVVIPRSIDAVWSLPAPPPFTSAGVRYYFPPLFYGFLLALGVLAWRRGARVPAARLLIVAAMALVLFRTAAGRVSWSHTRFAVPMLGIAVVGFALEPLLRGRRRWAAFALAIPALVYFEPVLNVGTGWKLLSGWSARQRHDGLVPYPLRPGRGIYTSERNATEMATLAAYVEALPAGSIFDFTNERALYYLLRRRPATRCFDVPMLSAPGLQQEAMRQLRARPPVCVILGGEPGVAVFDGLSNRDRVPALAAWIDANYPVRTEIGRFVVATPASAP